MGLLVPMKSKYKAHDDSGALNSLVNIHGFTKDGGFWTKSGGCGVVVQCRGIDPECLEPERIDSITAHLDEAAKACDPNTTLRQYLFKRFGVELSCERYETPSS